jgi:heterodisulfide reductase subunit A-like polyferredoxin
MTVNAALCQGCGSCALACPSKAIMVHQSTFEQIMAQVEVLDWNVIPIPASLEVTNVTA